MATARDEERQYQRTLVETLETFGYEVSHSYPLQTKMGGWQTGNTAKGWPDLVAARVPRLLAIEVKSATGRIPDEQRAWLSIFAGIPSARAWCLRPTDDWPMTLDWIRRPKEAPRAFGFRVVDDPDEIAAILGRARKRRPARAR